MATGNTDENAPRSVAVKEELMDNKELQKKVWTSIEKSQKKAAKFEDTVAVSFALISEANEDLYVAVVDGKLAVEPYHYNDCGCDVEASAETVNKLFSGELSFDKALKDGLAVVKGGDVGKFKALECLVPSKKTAKSADKKTAKAPAKAAAKKTAPAKAAKPAAKAAPAAKPAVKADEKKAAPAAKPAAVKTEEKKAAPAAKPTVKTEEKKAAPAAKPAAKTTAKK